jgi:hypothetical protein
MYPTRVHRARLGGHEPWWRGPPRTRETSPPPRSYELGATSVSPRSGGTSGDGARNFDACS